MRIEKPTDRSKAHLLDDGGGERALPVKPGAAERGARLQPGFGVQQG